MRMKIIKLIVAKSLEGRVVERQIYKLKGMKK